MAHVFWTGGAIHAQHINGQRFQRGKRSGDIGAEEHAAADIERDLHLQRNARFAVGEIAVDAVDGRLDLENVLAGFQQQQVCAALREPLRLFIKQIGQFVETDITEIGIVAGGQFTAGTHAAGDKTRNAGFGFDGIAGCAGDLCRGAIDFQDAVAEPMLGQGQAIAAECIGLNGFAADAQE